MLHSALPRVYLSGPPAPSAAPPLGYHYMDDLHHHPYVAYPQLEDVYALRLSEQRVLAWEASLQHHHQQQQQQQQHHQHQEQQNQQADTPCPLDLSLKPAATNTISDDCEAIEVDDEEDRRSREEARNLHHRRDDDEDSQRSCSSASLGYPSTSRLILSSPIHQSKHQNPTQSSYQHLLQTPPHQPMTPPSTPSPPQCLHKRKESQSPSMKIQDIAGKPPRIKKKHARKLKFDEDTSSPVSGTVILGPDEAVVTGDIDPAFNIVEVTDEARAELAKIENKLGPYQCKLCRQLHDDAFQLAQHRCSRIAHVEYRCPECDKRFSCPANLASHRRWHKPRPGSNNNNNGTDGGNVQQFSCNKCDAKFNKQNALKKHFIAQHSNEQNNNNNNNNHQEECKVMVDNELA